MSGHSATRSSPASRAVQADSGYRLQNAFHYLIARA